MDNKVKETYEAPTMLVVEVKMDSVILQMSQMGTEDYNYGGLDG